LNLKKKLKMARKKNARKARNPQASGFANTKNQSSKNSNVKEEMKDEINDIRHENDNIKINMIEARKNFETKIAEIKKDNEKNIENIEKKLKETIGTISVLTEQVGSLTENKRQLETKMVQENLKFADELQTLEKKHSKETNLLITKINQLEITNKQLTEKHKELEKCGFENKMTISCLQKDLKSCVEDNQRLVSENRHLEEKLTNQENNLKAIIVENKKSKDEIESLKSAISLGENKIDKLKEKNDEYLRKTESLKLSLITVKNELKLEQNQVENLKKQQIDFDIEKNLIEVKLKSLTTQINDANADNMKNKKNLKSILLELEVQGMELAAQHKTNDKLVADCQSIKNEKEILLDELLATRQQLTKIKKLGLFRRIFKKY